MTKVTISLELDEKTLKKLAKTFAFAIPDIIEQAKHNPEIQETIKQMMDAIMIAKATEKSGDIEP